MYTSFQSENFTEHVNKFVLEYVLACQSEEFSVLRFLCILYKFSLNFMKSNIVFLVVSPRVLDLIKYIRNGCSATLFFCRWPSLGAGFTASTQLVYRSLRAKLTAQICWVYYFQEPLQSLSSASPFLPYKRFWLWKAATAGPIITWGCGPCAAWHLRVLVFVFNFFCFIYFIIIIIIIIKNNIHILNCYYFLAYIMATAILSLHLYSYFSEKSSKLPSYFTWLPVVWPSWYHTFFPGVITLAVKRNSLK